MKYEVENYHWNSLEFDNMASHLLELNFVIKVELGVV
jgi:hypothetical protein